MSPYYNNFPVSFDGSLSNICSWNRITKYQNNQPINPRKAKNQLLRENLKGRTT